MATQTVKKHKTIEYGRYGYLFIAPFFIVYLVFQLWPLIYTFILSFQDIYVKYGDEINDGFTLTKNYASVFVANDGTASMAIRTFGNTAIIWIFNFIPQILLSLLLAVWLTDTKVKLKGAGAFKVMVYLPNVITAASISILFFSMFGPNGPLTKLVMDLGWIDNNRFFIDNAAPTRGIISFIQFWMWYGNTTLLLISGVLGINPSIFEASDIDGCTGWQKFIHITLPMLRPIMLYVLVTSLIGGLQMYDIPSLFNVNMNTGRGMPDDASTTVTMYIRFLTKTGNFGRAAAVSVILFLVTLILSVLFFVFMGDRDKKAKKKG